jgi:outer membrane protein, multidrug efflux system
MSAPRNVSKPNKVSQVSTRGTLSALLGLALLPAAMLVGCAVGEDYKRPEVQPPAEFRGTTAPGTSLGASDWRSVFTDPVQQALIDEALKTNLDLRTAESRIREGQAGVVIARSGGLPTVALGLSTSPTARLPGDNLTSSFLAAGLLSWEIDLWGRVRRGTEAARGDLAAREAARDGAQVSLVAEVASRHFELAALRDVLASTESNAALQADSLRLMRRRNSAGLVSAAEVRQSEAQLAATRARIPDIKRQITATENALSLLLARAPGAIDTTAVKQSLPPSLPAGLPSELIERRPDLREAEQRLVAANARVGEAKAQLLPSLSVTGAFGSLSTALGDLFSSKAADVASLGPNLKQTLYAGGALRANQDAAEARLEQALLAYRKAGLNALREVSDALTAYERSGEQLDREAERVVAQREALRLADKRFAAGVVSFFEVLDAQRQLLAAETDVVNARLQRQLAYVQVFRALGGGWSKPAPVVAAG